MSVASMNGPLAVREAPASYVLDALRVRPSYKQTEVGVIPEDWDVKQIGDLKPFVTSGSRGWAAFYSDRGAPFIRITNLSRGSIYLDLEDLRLVNLPQEPSEGIRTQLQDHDVLISITADIGIIGYVSEDVQKPAYINQHIALVRFDSSNTAPKFVSYFLASERPQKLFRALTDSGAKAGMSLQTVKKVHLALPPTKAEQESIAEALSDADALIESLEQLVAKKRQLKQGAMQELLTGKKHLSGFGGEWEVKRLGEICYMKSGEGITSAQIDEHSPFPCYGGNGLRGFTNRYTHDGNYALIGRQGALCGNVVAVTGKFFASEHAIVVTPLNEIDIHWLACVLIRMNLNQYSESSAQPGLSVSKLLALDGIVPPTKEEQTAIATLLSDMDTEIAALETWLAKTRELKQGMMQELLTGKIRLGTRASSPHAGETPALPWTPRSPRSKPALPRPANSSKA